MSNKFQQLNHKLSYLTEQVGPIFFQINLLDMKRSMNVNIFLKQFRLPNNEIVAMVKEGKAEEINAERLRGLLKIMPERDEVSGWLHSLSNLMIIFFI